MNKFLLCMFVLIGWIGKLPAQAYSYWGVGDTTDFVGNGYVGGVVLAGGGGDNDEAMTWMLNRAGGGDVVIIRASNSDGYNNYFYSELGVSVHSVETIRFNNISASTDSFVINKIRGAEVLFIAGGDQYDYYQYWRGNAIGDAINYLINEKKVTVGGTSAGMAILGGIYYTPSGGSLTAEQALINPFHPNTDILGRGDFLQTPFLTDLVTDTHYDQRDRQGRHVVFMARAVADFGVPVYGIACNEYTAVCVDTNGIARVFGDYPQFNDIAYFLKSNCQSVFEPEVIFPGQPLTWYRNQAAVKVYQLPGKVDGAPTFDLNDWETGTGGEWQSWYVLGGSLNKRIDTGPACDETLTSLDADSKNLLIRVYPNPVSHTLYLKSEVPGENGSLRISDLQGRIRFKGQMRTMPLELDVSTWPAGTYFLEVSDGTRTWHQQFIKS